MLTEVKKEEIVVELNDDGAIPLSQQVRQDVLLFAYARATRLQILIFRCLRLPRSSLVTVPLSQIAEGGRQKGNFTEEKKRGSIGRSRSQAKTRQVPETWNIQRCRRIVAT